MSKRTVAVCIVLSVMLAAAAYFFAAPHQRMPPKKYFLGVAAIMKNEKPYLKEWLEYHRLQGVEHFYLCDNGSTDGTAAYLEPYVAEGVITYISLPGVDKQAECYEKIVAGYGRETEWLAFIDLDEFLVPLQDGDMADFLHRFADVDEVSLHWMNYGDNGIFSRSGGLVTELFTAHARFLNHTVKSIVRPGSVIGFKPFGSNHYIPVRGKSVNEYGKPVDFMLNFNISADKARVNHYITKSFAEFLNKKGRGHPEGTPIDYGYYFFHNENEVKNDTSMQRFLPGLKQRMAQSPLPDVSLPQPEGLPETFAGFYFTPEEVSQIIGREYLKPAGFYETQQLWKNHLRPVYAAPAETAAGNNAEKQEK